MVRAGLPLAALALVALASCAQDATALHVIVEAPTAFRSSIDGVRVTVRRPGSPAVISQRLFLRSQLSFPFSLTVQPNDPDLAVEVTAEAFDSETASTTPISVARLITNYTLHETLVVPLVLYPGCAPGRCPIGSTCTALAASTVAPSGCENAVLGDQDRAPYRSGVDARCPPMQLRRGAQCISDDAGVDAGTDAGADVTTDDRVAPTDQPTPGDVVIPVDAGADGGEDVAPTPDVVDAGSPDTGSDVPGTDAVDVTVADVPSMDVVDAPSFDAGSDAPDVVDVPAMDAGTDVGVDVGVDVGTDAPVSCTSTCAGTANCLGGFCDARPFESCLAILAAVPGAPSGAYTLLPRASVPYRAWCDMTSAGGGWTLVLKADGSATTFLHSQSIWDDRNTIRPDSTDMTATEAKFESYFRVPFNDMRLVFRMLASAEPDRDAVLTAWGDGSRTLLDWMAVSPPSARFRGAGTTIERKARWAGLFPTTGSLNASLPGQCVAEGFNLRTGNSPTFVEGVRIGMITTDQSTGGGSPSVGICATSNSRVGVGGEYTPCSIGSANAVGNAACATLPVNERDTRAFAWVFVR